MVRPIELAISAERRFQLLVGAVTDYAIFMLDPDGRVASWNSGAERIKGYSEDEILGAHFSRFYTDDDQLAEMPARTLKIAAKDGRYEEEGWRIRKDGSRFWAGVVVEAVRDEAGDLLGFAKITQDFSTRKGLEERFRRVVESAPNAMVMVDAGGRIAMVNAQAEGVFGYSRDELLGQPVEILVPDRFRRHHPGLRGSFLTDPRSRPMGAGRDLYGLRKDGSEFPVEIGLNPIETPEGMMVLSAIIDLSTRKRLEERFRRVVEAAPNAMVMIDAGGRIEMVNAQAENVFGYSRTELLGQPVEMLVPERFRDRHPHLRGTFFAGPQSRPMGAGRDLYALRKDGSEFPVEIGLNPIETDEGTMVLSAIVDISDRKHREERIRAALKEKDILLAEIHHRVKNNLQVIHSLLDLQSARIEDETVLNMLRDSQNRIKSMAMIHQTLYESRDFARVDFSAFLDTLVPTLMASYGASSGRVRLSIAAEEVMLPINAAIPCGLVVNELISNALKHAFPGDAEGEIKIDLVHELDDFVTLSVGDDGVGIPADLDLAQVDTLGLQLVTLLADQLGADMTMQRANPTRFALRFLLKDEDSGDG